MAKYQNNLRLFSKILKNIKKLSNTEHNNYVTDNVKFLTELQKGWVITYDNDSFNPNIKNIEKIDTTKLTKLEEELWQLKNTAEKLCNQPDNSIKLNEKSKKLYESNLALYNKILSNIEAVKSARLNAQELIAKQEEQEAKKAEEEGENKTAAKQELKVEPPKKTAKKIAKQAAAGKVPVEGKNKAAAKNTEEFAAEQEVLERAAEAEENKAAVAKYVPSALEKRRAELNKATEKLQQAKCTEEKQARDDVYKLARKLAKEAEEQIRSAQEQSKEASDALEEAIAKKAEFYILNPDAPEFLQNTARGPAQQDSRSGASGSWQDRAARADTRNNTKSPL